MNDISKCCTCGYEWKTGLDGTHSCTSILNNKVDKANSILDMIIHELPRTIGNINLNLILEDLKQVKKALTK